MALCSYPLADTSLTNAAHFKRSHEILLLLSGRLQFQAFSSDPKFAVNFVLQSLKPPILLFVESKERAKQLHRELTLENVKVDSIHADKRQEQRDEAVEKFRLGTTWVLIATDLMARGMDFKGVNCVINYDVPASTATYIHRVGRSGRAGRSGQAITLYTNQDVAYLRSIANVIRGAGCEVPEWILSLRKSKAKRGKKIVRPSIG